MGPSWAHAFVAAALLTLAGTPLLRRMALATNFVDDPTAEHKRHKEPIPYLGGIGLIVGVLVGLLFTSSLTPQVKVIALGGSFIGCLGLLDDHRSVGALFRFAVELGVAAAVLAAGLRIHATDTPAIDGVFTLIWIVGVTNAVNLLDNMDGLAAGVTAAAATAIFGLAVLGEQPTTAILAAGLAGACVGFLAHNKRPASIFMGDTGSLFLGFVLAVSTLDVSPALTPPGSFAVPLMLLALPVLDTSTVTVCRLRRGRSIALGGKDHLSHRLEARGLSAGPAVAVLVGVEAVVGVLAVLAGREVIPLAVAVLAVAAVLAALAFATVQAPVYTEVVVGLPRRLKVVALACVAGLGLLAAPAALALVRAHGPGVAAATSARSGLAALAAGDAARATELFGRSTKGFDRARSILNNPINSTGLILPGLRVNLAAARAVVDAGRDATAAASSLSSVAEASSLRVGGASDPLRELTALSPALRAAAATMQTAAGRLGGFDRPYLWPSLDTSLRQLRTSLLQQASTAISATDIGRLLPPMLGATGSRRYFLAVEDNAELRGGGGVIHFWGEVLAEGGHLRITHFGPIQELYRQGAPATLDLPADLLERYRQFDIANTWQNVNVSPDFTVTGRVITSLYAQSGGPEVDGVIAVDLPGLAALLDLAGPIRVDGWPEPISGENVVDVLIRDSYQRAPSPGDQQALVSRVMATTLTSFATTDLGPAPRVARVLGAAAAGGHLSLYASRPDEEDLARQLGVAGEVPRVMADSVMVVNQNLSAVDIDPYLRRQTRYTVTLSPGEPTTVVNGRLDVSLRNDAPSSGLARGIIGPFDSRFAPGENRTYVSVYSPLSLGRATLGGSPIAVDQAREFGRQVYSAIVDVPSQQSRTMSVTMKGEVGLVGGWYQLDLLHQTSLTRDDTVVSISVPKGWRIAETTGLRMVGTRRAVAEVGVADQHQIAVRVERTAWSRLWHPTDQEPSSSKG